jgi:inorganic pyrophosphatase
MSCIDIVIETPRGSAEKYNYDPELHLFKLKKILPAGMVFPYDFGFIPGTKGDDGDPLDIIVISEFHSFPGCLMKCRVIGAIEAEQSEKKRSDKMIRNDRFIAIPKVAKMFAEFDSIRDLPGQVLEELGQFFINYNKIEEKKFKVLSIIDGKEALRLIESKKIEFDRECFCTPASLYLLSRWMKFYPDPHNSLWHAIFNSIIIINIQLWRKLVPS